MKRELAKLNAVYLSQPPETQSALSNRVAEIVRGFLYLAKQAPDEMRAAGFAVIGASAPKLMLMMTGMLKEDEMLAIVTNNAPALYLAVIEAIRKGAGVADAP